MSELTYVVAYNYRIYRQWCQEQHIRPIADRVTTQYATVDKLRIAPASGPDYVIKALFIGEWVDRNDGHLILEWLGRLGAINADTGRPVTEMITAALEAVREQGQAVIRSLQAAQRSRPLGDDRGDVVGRPGIALRCPCDGCAAQRARMAPRSEVPSMPGGHVPVYLLDGARQDQVYPMLPGWQTLVVPNPLDNIVFLRPVADPAELSRPLQHPYYRVTTVSACLLMGAMGLHDYDQDVCAQEIRLGMSGSQADYSVLLQRARKRILNTLAPGWERLMYSPLLSRPPEVPPTMQYPTYTYDYVEHAFGWRTAPTSQALPRLVNVGSSDENWPNPNSSMDYGVTCAHICGDDHRCEARAATSIVYKIPSGGVRSMPVCGVCYAAETAAIAAQEVEA